MTLCHCGRPLHYRDPVVRAYIEQQIATSGEYVTVTVDARSWRVPRHYIALHGLRASELPSLGFEET
jgi:hypothetical protein